MEAISHLQFRQKIMMVTLVITLLPTLLIGTIYFSAYKSIKVDGMLNKEQDKFSKTVDTINNMYYSSLKKSVYITNNLQILQLLRQDYSDDLLSYMNNMENVTAVLDALKSDYLNNKIIIYGYNSTLYVNNEIQKIGQLDPEVKHTFDSLPDSSQIWRIKKDETENQFYIHFYSRISNFNEYLAVRRQLWR